MRDVESPVTLEIERVGQSPLLISALLHRDPGHLSWNRLSLVGSTEDMWLARACDTSDEFSWSLYVNPSWPTDGSTYGTIIKGFIKSTGIASGLNIAEDSTQAVGEASIHELVETIEAPHWGKVSANFWFLQRPVSWLPYGRNKSWKGLSRVGDWCPLPSLGLKYRLAQVSHFRSDARQSSETELIQIPSVEMEPIGKLSASEFHKKADDLWFGFRILLAFRHRQLINTLHERREGGGRVESVWHTIAVEPKAPRDRDGVDQYAFRGKPEGVFSRALPFLHRFKDQHEILHAAAYGYAESYQASVLESALTSCVEALERLVTVFEATRGHDREVIDKARWKSVAKSLKAAIDGAALTRIEKSRLKRSLSAPAPLSLQERLERMVRAYRRNWSEHDRHLLAGLQSMIRARNDIVHGRAISDINALHVEVVRARAIFERLFLNLLGSNRPQLSSIANVIIGHHERSKEG